MRHAKTPLQTFLDSMPLEITRMVQIAKNHNGSTGNIT